MSKNGGPTFYQETPCTYCLTSRVHSSTLLNPKGELLEAGFKPGSALEITGYVPDRPDRFEVNLQNREKNITLFHFNPRFPEQVIVRNRWINNAWDPNEEKHGGFPLKTNSAHRIVIIAEAKWFRVLINGCEHSKFEYRSAVELITHVSICGDFVDVECKYIAAP